MQSQILEKKNATWPLKTIKKIPPTADTESRNVWGE